MVQLRLEERARTDLFVLVTLPKQLNTNSSEIMTRSQEGKADVTESTPYISAELKKKKKKALGILSRFINSSRA